MQPVSHRSGRDWFVLRFLGVCEWIKGFLALILAYAVLSGPTPGPFRRILQVHFRPDHPAFRLLARLGNEISPVGLISFALSYALLRWIEGYGLWLDRQWAKVLSVVSIALYLPAEVYLQARHPGVTNFCVIVLNAAVMLYMASLLPQKPRLLLQISQASTPRTLRQPG